MNDRHASHPSLRALHQPASRPHASAQNTIKASAKGINSRLLQFEGGEACLLACGFKREGEAYVHDCADDASARAAEARAAIARFERVRTAVELVGDRNAPAVAQECLKLCTTYCANAAADAGKRRIPATGKALQARLLAADGGNALIESVGFELEGGAEAGAYVCALETPLIALGAAALRKGEDFWRELAGASRPPLR